MRRLAMIGLVAMLLVRCAPPALIPATPQVSDLAKARAVAHRERGAQLLVEKGQAQKAADEFGQALEFDPGDLTCRFWAGWTAGLLGDQDQAFEHMLWAANSGKPLSELAIWMAYRLFSTKRQGERLAAVLNGLIEKKQTPPTVRSRALYFMGHSLRYLGRGERGAAAFAELGYLKDWMLVGPFNNDQNAGFDTVYPPEKGFLDYRQKYQGKLSQVGFRRVNHLDFDGRVNLAALLDPSRWTCAYLVSFVHSDRIRDVALRLGAYRGVKLWLNGRLLLKDDRAEIGSLDQYVLGGRLERGWNRLLVKVCQRTGPWQLRLRITDPEGRPLPRLASSTDIHTVPDRSGDKTPLPRVSSLQVTLSEMPDAGMGFARLVKEVFLRRQGFFQAAVEQAVELAEQHPSSPLYRMELARAHFAAQHEGAALKALRAAEGISPGLPDAVMERARYEQRNNRAARAMRILDRLDERARSLPAVRLLRVSLLSDRGFNVDALRELETLLSLQPERASLWSQAGGLHNALGQRRAARHAYRRALDLCANDSSTYDRLIEAALRRGEDGRAIRMVRRKNRMFPCLMTSALKEAEILLAQGKFAKALIVTEGIGKIAPDYWYLHKLRGDIFYRRGDKRQALGEYEKTIALRPDNPDLSEYLDFLEKKKDAAFERYALDEAEVDRIIAGRPARSAYPEAETVFLLDDQITHLYKDGSSRHLVHQIYQVRTEKGQRNFNKFRVPSASSFRLEVAETIQPDGTRQEATSIRRGVIHFPSLQPGSILHVAFRYETSSLSWMQDEFAMNYNFQGQYPSQRARWVLVMPADKKLTILIRGKLVKQQQQALGDEKAFIWTAKDAPMLHREVLSPPMRTLRAAVFVSTVPSWDKLAKWQNSLIADQFEIDDDVRKKTRQLVQDAKTPMEKLERIYHFVAKDIRYLNHDVGIFGKKPNKAINIFENKFGDCKDKATLMIAMLKAAGIRAAYAGIRTFDRGPVFWKVPQAQTNHIVTYVPAQPGVEKPLFIDGTSQYGNMLYLPDRDQGLRTLVLDGSGHEFVETPLLAPESSTLDFRSDARIAGDSLVIEAHEKWSGWFASWFRSRLNVEGKRNEELTQEMNYRFPGTRLSNDTYQGLDDLSPAAVVTFKLDIPGRVRNEGGTLRVNPLWSSNLVRRMAQKPDRHYDLFMVYRTNMTLVSKLAIPEADKIVTLPRSLEIDNDLVRFRQDCVVGAATLNLSTVTCSRKLTIKKRIIPIERYHEFRKICRRIDEAEAQDIVLRPL
ncbi:MAG TPA: transglutaminase domain-containing protein [Myxococcota bacterium]|nr:transglutaminase domain-containing protein [Myxococcota bacterium]